MRVFWGKQASYRMDANREHGHLFNATMEASYSRRTNSKSNTKKRPWLYETLSSILAALNLVGLVILLRCYQEQPEPQWGGSITLNTIAAIISTAFRAALIIPVAACISQLSWLNLSGKSNSLEDHCFYDQASRGPIGSLRLLFHTRLR